MYLSKRRRANRLNSLNSTGPKTEEGKANSSRNALTHGLTALIPDSLLAPEPHGASETAAARRQEADRLLEAYARDYTPANQTESDLVRTLATLQFQLLRADAYLEFATRDIYTTDPPFVLRLFENFTRQQTRVQRAYAKTLTELRALQADRHALDEHEIELASRTLRHLEADKEPGHEDWKPDENGFNFTREEVEWYAEVAADDDYANSALPIRPPRMKFVSSGGTVLWDSENPNPTDEEWNDKLQGLFQLFSGVFHNRPLRQRVQQR